MGVKGLLPLLRSIHKPCSLKQFAGQTLGIDAYGWLHRGTISCAIELGQGKPTTKFVDFAMTRVRMLLHFGVTPLLVFDGDYLPSKKNTEKERAAKRRDAKAAGLELLQLGRHAQAYQELQKGIDVTPEMARQFMDELDKAKVRFIVAPYEADSQLVYLEKTSIISGIISEDSDMLVFGAKVLLTKLDQFGECVAIHRKDFTACKEISLVGWSDAEFRTMSILSGCDYLAPIGNVGLKTAYRLIRKHKTVDRIVKALQFDGKSKIPPTYLDDFRAAELTFLHQWVYCPEARQLVNITAIPDTMDVESMPFIGPRTPDEVASKVADGKLHPHTKQPLYAPAIPPPRHFKTLEKALQERTPQLKKHQSIESFFRPKRTPLAELDPNLFTPSPSQQRLLEQQQEEFQTTASPAAIRPPSLMRAATDVQRAQSARRAVSERTPATGHISPKRQRLCSDSAVGIAPDISVKVHAGQSRFFAKPNTFQSPSVLKAGRRDQSRKSKIEVWSDDSIEDGFVEISKLSNTSTKKSNGKLAVFRDSDSARGDKAVDSQSSVDTQSTKASVELPNFSQDDKLSAVLLKSFGSPVDTTRADSGADTCTNTLVDDVAVEKAPLSSRKEVADLVADDADIVPASSPLPIQPEDNISEDDWLEVAKMPIKPLPMTKELAVFSVDQANCGSEDLLVPQSEEEEDEEQLCEASPKASFGLNLGRFAFAG